MKSSDRVNAMDMKSPLEAMPNLFDDLQDEIPFLNERPYVPPQNKWVNLISEAAANTPDFRTLKNDKEAEFLVLVCDNLQLGRNLNHMLKGAHYYGKGETVYEGFTLKKTRDGLAVPFRMKKVGYKGSTGYAYPGGFTCIRSQDVGVIEGDVYGVPLRLLTMLDKVRQNTVRCNRQRNLCRLIHPRQHNKYVKCYLWEGNHIFYSNTETDPQYMTGMSMKIRQNVQVLFN